MGFITLYSRTGYTSVLALGRKKFFYLHLIEYKEYPIKLRAARGKRLADPWDDYPSDAYDVAKSWKHNSRRKHQYYRLSNPTY